MIRSPFQRFAAVLALAIVVVTPSFAAEQKRRAVKPGGAVGTVSPPAAAEVTLTGILTDATTRARVISVQVSAIGKSGFSDSTGTFRIKLPLNTDVTLRFARTGYETTTAHATLTSDAQIEFSLVPKGTVKVRTVAGPVLELDSETVEFGYIAPFSGYNKDTHLNLCGTSGASYSPERAEIRSIKPHVQIVSASCCNGASVPGVDVTQTNGTTITGSFIDACFGYKVDIIGQDHKTAQPYYVHFSDIVDVTFP